MGITCLPSKFMRDFQEFWRLPTSSLVWTPQRNQSLSSQQCTTTWEESPLTGDLRCLLRTLRATTRRSRDFLLAVRLPVLRSTEQTVLVPTRFLIWLSLDADALRPLVRITSQAKLKLTSLPMLVKRALLILTVFVTQLAALLQPRSDSRCNRQCRSTLLCSDARTTSRWAAPLSTTSPSASLTLVLATVVTSGILT